MLLSGGSAEPREIADVAVFLCSDRASYMTGATVDVSGGLAMHWRTNPIFSLRKPTMTNEPSLLFNRIRLSAMMFLQYMMVAVWWVPLAAYLKTVGVGAAYEALILSTMALGCLTSPLVGMLADRHFAGQHVLFVLNLVGGVLLVIAGLIESPIVLFILLLVHMLCYMPTWGLTSAIAMAHAPSEKFPQIRVFGSIGWVLAAVFSVVAVKVFGVAEKGFDTSNLPMLCGAGVGFAGALLALTLPNTPPPAKGKQGSIVDVLGLRALTLMKDFYFALYIVLAMLVMIPFAAYFNFGSAFLNDKGFQYLTLTMNLGQFAEMFFMVAVPFVLAKCGIRWTLILGLIALTAGLRGVLAGRHGRHLRAVFRRKNNTTFCMYFLWGVMPTIIGNFVTACFRDASKSAAGVVD